MTDSQIIIEAVKKAKKAGWVPNGLQAGLYGVIFNHDFAEAFWGKEWQSHLQQLVLLKQPLKYVEMFL